MLQLPRESRRCWKLLLRLNQSAGCLSTSVASVRPAGTAAEASAAPPPPLPVHEQSMLVLPMPKLSPEMQSGTLAKWLKQEGDWINRYDLVCEVETDQLVEEAYRLGDFAGRVTLLIESQEEGLLARCLAPEGTTLPAGAPIAVVWEGDGDTSSSSSSSDRQGAEGTGVSAGLEAARAWVPPTSDVYDEAQAPVRVLEWQSYLKESKEPPGCSKCMG